MKPMLAAPSDGNDLKYPIMVSPKLDGVRAIIIDGVVMSRSLKPIPNKYVQSLFGLEKFNGFDGERDSWVSDDKEVVISSGCGVRLKIKGRTVERGNITAIGTIKDNYLGLIDDGSGDGEGL